MANLGTKTFRIKVDKQSHSGAALIDENTGSTLRAWKGGALDIQIGAFDGDTVESVSDIVSVNVKIQPNNLSDAGILADSTTGVFDDTLTSVTWEDGTKQHCTVSFTNAQMNLDLGTKTSKLLWIVITAITTGGSEIVLGGDQITLYEANNDAGDPPPENPGTTLTLEEADLRYVGQADIDAVQADLDQLGVEVTDVLDGTGVTYFEGITVESPTTIRFGEIHGWFKTYGENPSRVYKEFPATTGITPAFLGSANVTRLAKDINGDLIQISGNAYWTPDQAATLLIGGQCTHLLGVNTISNVASRLNRLDNTANRFSIFLESFGNFNVDGNVFTGLSGLAQMQKSDGTIFSNSINYDINPNDQDRRNTPALSPVTFQQVTRNAVPLISSTIDVNNYDVGGVVTPIPGSKYVIRRIYLFADNNVAMTYGQETYTSESNAINAIEAEPVDLLGSVKTFGTLRGYVIHQRGDTDSDNWVILEANLPGGSATGKGQTNLTWAASPTGGTVGSDTGLDATLTLADGTNAGLLTPSGYTKINESVSYSNYLELAENYSGGLETPSAGSASQTLNNTRILGSSSLKGGYLDSLDIYLSTAGTLIFKRISGSPALFTVEDEFIVTIDSTGLSSLSRGVELPNDFKLEAGDYLGIYSANGAQVARETVTDELFYTVSGNFTGSSAPTATSNNLLLQVGFSIKSFDGFNATELSGIGNRLTGVEDKSKDSFRSLTVGESNPQSGTTLSTGLTRIHGKENTRSGVIKTVNLYAETAGDMKVKVFSRSGSDFTCIREQNITVVLGNNSISVDLPIESGQYVGLYYDTGVVGFISGDDGLWFDSVDLEPGETATYSNASTSDMQLNWEVEYLDTVLRPYLLAESSTQLSIYIPASEYRYIEYRYQRRTDLTTKHYDIWELGEVYLCDSGRTRIFNDTLTAGNSRWEHAVQVSGDADFSGGSIHGWEQIEEIGFLVDGVEWTPAAGEFSFTQFDVIQKTNLFRWKATSIESEDLIAYTNTHTTFSDEGVRLRTYLDWQDSLTIGVAYVAMLPCRRDDGSGTQITATGVTDGMPYGSTDISASGHAQTQFRNTTRALAYGGDLGVTFEVQQIKRPSTAGNTFFSSTAQYNKIYTYALQGDSVTSSITSYYQAEHLIKITAG